MSKSANDTADELVRAVQRARVGTRYAANYLAPRNYYYTLSSADDFMSLQLLVIDQARTQCENLISYLSHDKSIWRGRIKQLGSMLYKPKTYPLPICNEVGQALLRNMTEDEVTAYATMASYIDDVIGADLDKLANSIFTETGRVGIANQEAMTRVLSCHLFLLIATHILERCEELQGGSHYHVCYNPTIAPYRDRAYMLCPRDVERMSGITFKLISEVVSGRRYDIPYTTSMEASVIIICNKICDVVNIYNACKEADIDISKNSRKDMEALVAKALQKKADNARPQTLNEQPKPADLAQAFADKGWKIKQQ